MSKPYVDRCFVSEDNKFVYLFMPRNGSQSFRNCGLFGNENPIKYRDSYRDLIKIIILREPIERVVSIYLWKKRRSIHNRNLKDIEPFKSFILGLINERNELTAPQLDYLSKKGLTIADIEEVFTLDNYNNDVKNFSAKYNLDLEIVHLNQSRKERFDILLQFINGNDDIKNKLTNVYKEDIELYNSQTKKK